MWCAQFKSAERTFELSQPSLFCLVTIRTCGLSATHMYYINKNGTISDTQVKALF